MGRVYQGYETLNLIKGNWLFGKGIGVEWFSLFHTGSTFIDGLYFALLGHQGIVGLSLYLFIVALWTQRSFYLIKNHKLLQDNLTKAFVFAQPLYIAGTMLSGITESAYYLGPSMFTLRNMLALTTEFVYQKTKMTGESKLLPGSSGLAKEGEG